MGKVLRILMGMLLGALVGAGLAMLFAPESGKELQHRIEDWWADVQEAGHQAAEQKRVELTAQLEELKQPEA